MKQCQSIQEQLSERLDNRLDAGQTAAFDAHVAACASCRQQWQQHVAMWDALGRAPGTEPSFGFVQRTIRRLDEAPRSLWQWPVLRWAAAVVAVAVAVGWFALHQSEQDTRVVTYQAVTQDRLDDFDVIAYLDQLEGETRL
jgi:anti-sigma factor RsiW